VVEMNIGQDWVGLEPDYNDFLIFEFDPVYKSCQKLLDLDRTWIELMENNCRIVWKSCIMIVKRIAGLFAKDFIWTWTPI